LSTRFGLCDASGEVFDDLVGIVGNAENLMLLVLTETLAHDSLLG
jgi:hypothetical protein